MQKHRWMLDFQTNLQVNSFYLFNSLRPDEVGSARRTIEDLEYIFIRENFLNKYYEVFSAAGLLEALEELARASRHGLRPILHFDMHGSPNKGLLIASSGEYIPWAALVDQLRKINVATGNNLLVVMSSCYGFNSIYSADITKPSPFYALIAPISEISSGFLEDNMTKFYRSALGDSDIFEAYWKYLSSKMEIFHSDKIFVSVFGRYVMHWCKGKGRDQRKEQLLSTLIGMGLPNTAEHRKHARKAIAGMIRPTQSTLDKHMNLFLVGKKIDVKVNDIIRLIEG